MYGLVIEGVRFMIREKYGEKTLEEVLVKCHLSGQTLSTHDRYSEKMVPNMLVAVCEVLGITMEEVGVLAGRYFVLFMVKHGYGELMQVMGRRFADFLKGLDNLHEYFRFSYPKIRPPSFYCSRESSTGLTLHYRSRRQGYIAYVMGQLIEVAKLFFKQDIQLQVTNRQQKGSFQFVVIKVRFDNTAIEADRRLKEKSMTLNEYLPVDSYSFLSMFPYFVTFNKKLEVQLCGRALMNVVPDLVGQRMDEQFDLQRPCIKFSWDGCMAHLNCNFQMESLYPIQKKIRDAITFKVNDQIEDKVEVPDNDNEEGVKEVDEESEVGEQPYLQLRGPIIYLKSCDCMIYLPTCVVEELDSLFSMGLFLNDYSDADCNREIIMATIQKSDDLKNLLKNEKERSMVLSGMMKEIAQSKKKARELLCQMMPREVANTLLATGQTGNVCESFEEVTIAFAKVCDFLVLTQKMAAADVVNLLNNIYSHFDELVDRHGVYKVETIGESYMISAGIPYRTEFHAEFIGDAALDMVATIKSADIDTGSKSKKVAMKIGVYSGPCVGGIVGKRAPRYCLFGDAVNCASRMESHNKQPLTIQIGPLTKECLERAAPGKFKFKHRGMITLKGKGEMKAYGLIGKAGRPRYQSDPMVFAAVEEEIEEENLAYTPIEEKDQDRASTMSRMSITAYSRGSSQQRGASGSGEDMSPSRSGSPSERGSNASGAATPRGFDQQSGGVHGVALAARLAKEGTSDSTPFNMLGGGMLHSSSLSSSMRVASGSTINGNLALQGDSKKVPAHVSKSEMVPDSKTYLSSEKKEEKSREKVTESKTNLSPERKEEKSSEKVPDIKTNLSPERKEEKSGEKAVEKKYKSESSKSKKPISKEPLKFKSEKIKADKEEAEKKLTAVKTKQERSAPPEKAKSTRSDSKGKLEQMESAGGLTPPIDAPTMERPPPIKPPTIEEQVRQEAREIVDAQIKSASKNLEKKIIENLQPLPPIEGKEIGLGHEHGQLCCKCDAIRKDPKLKTKVCIIISIMKQPIAEKQRELASVGNDSDDDGEGGMSGDSGIEGTDMVLTSQQAYSND